MLVSPVSDGGQDRAPRTAHDGLEASVRFMAEQLTALRPGIATDHLVRLWVDAILDVYVAADVTPQEQARLRSALVELRSYAGVRAAPGRTSAASIA